MGRQMKDSGIEWVGVIPSDWSIIANKYVMQKNKRICQVWRNEDVLSLTLNGVVVRDLVNPSGKMPNTFDGYQYAYNGELLMCLFDMDVTPRCVGRVKNDGVTSPAYSCFKMYDDFSVNYFYYYYLLIDHRKELLHLAKNLRHSFTEEQLGVLKVPAPSLEEQHRIASYLDTQCSEIDNILEKTRASIEEYKKLKQTLITQAVTKGVRGERPMKDSGNEWIGEIPREWKSVKLKYCAYIRARLGWKGLKADEYVDEGYPLLSAFNIINSNLSFESVNYINEFRYNESPEIKISISDILLVKDGAGIGKCAIVEELPIESTVNGSIAVVTVEKHLEPKYLYYYFLSELFQQYTDRIKGGMGVPHLFQSDLKEIKVAFSNIDEQKEIVKFLDEKCEELDKIITKKEQLIKELESYKKSLIYECVTGKREV
ncbi:restriction endonuclease subunit S [Clostridium saccharoperbutylacetonicum]|uniref:restriction endonuclease subunit S n=1 Tax=Clostridium saccharoperbutylacetonicum TaxID=36745 RepID=UPI0039E99EB1